MTLSYSTDIVIFGGGVAGLWLLHRLRKAGYEAILLETDAIGGGQSIASQGIIHGGLKYALSGSLGGATQAIADMPRRWRDALAGRADVDLSQVRVLSDYYYMWSSGGFRSRLKTFLGSKSLRGRIEAVAKTSYPAFFSDATVDGSLYRLPDFVLDAGSLIACLRAPIRDRLFQIDSAGFQLKGKHITAALVDHGDRQVALHAQRYVFTAGSGNTALIEKAGLQNVRSQERPLNMVYGVGPHLPEVYVHCIGADFSMTPLVTVTSHRRADGQTVWYLGGELAEAGVGESEAAQTERARQLLTGLFPWVDLEATQWHCLPISRAEPASDGKRRPDDARVHTELEAIVAWPTKLTLAPVLADKVMNCLQDSRIKPGQPTPVEELRKSLPEPPQARPPWEKLS